VDTRAAADRLVGITISERCLVVHWRDAESTLAEQAKLGRVRQPIGPLLPGIAPSNVYPTADGTWIVVGANEDSVFARLAKAME
jgi:crotonobetainyl-CoA:carnitine CoA-transferase CaiB-like acyl-CoA transferase